MIVCSVISYCSKPQLCSLCLLGNSRVVDWTAMFRFGLGMHSMIPIYRQPSLQIIAVFTRESSYCFQRVLAITILSVHLSVHHTGGSVKNGAI